MKEKKHMKRMFGLLMALALIAAACGGGDTDAQALSDGCEEGETDGDLILYNWTEYTPTDPLAAEFEVTDFIATFEEQFPDVEVLYTEYDSNESMLAQVEAGVSYDLVHPSDYMVSIMKGEDLLVKLNRDAIPNFVNIDPAFADPGYDLGNEYSAPYQWGTTGIGYLYDAVDDSDGISWGVIFDIEQSEANKGKISFLDDERETLGAALIYLGYSLNTTTQSELDEAEALIKEAKENIATFNSSGFWDLLTAGDTDVAMGWNGDFLVAYDEYNLTDPEVDAYDLWGYAIPNEGAAAWVDTMAIPHNAEHPCTAHAYMNMVLDAFMGAELTHYNYYASPNLAAEEFIDPEYLADPFIYPPREMLEDGSLEFFVDLGEFTTNYTDAFARAKS